MPSKLPAADVEPMSRADIHLGGADRRTGASPLCKQARSARPGTLRCRVHGVDRLTRGHEQAVAFGTAEGDVAANFGQANAADQLAVWRPDRHAAVADSAACIAGCPDVAVDVAAQAVRPALHAVNHAIAEALDVR